MKVYSYTRNYKKEEKSLQDAILGGIKVLAERICQYEEQGTPFQQIFNDDKVKYDKHGNFFTFKYRKDKLQLRILYGYICVEEVPTIIIMDYVVKKKPKKEYITWFENLKDMDPMKAYEEAYYVTTIN